MVGRKKVNCNTVPLELQGRVKAVTLQGWADSTHTTYGAGLLVYHVFCNHSKIPKVDRVPASATLILSFVSMLVGSLSSKAIHNYIYSVRAWHTLYGLPWVLHEEQIATMLKGAAKLAPLAVKQDQCKLIVKDARPTQTYSFLPAFWAGDTHEETNVLPIGDQEEKRSDF